MDFSGVVQTLFPSKVKKGLLDYNKDNIDTEDKNQLVKKSYSKNKGASNDKSNRFKN